MRLENGERKMENFKLAIEDEQLVLVVNVDIVCNTGDNIEVSLDTDIIEELRKALIQADHIIQNPFKTNGLLKTI